MPFKPFDWLHAMTQLRWLRSSSSSTKSPARRPPTLNTRDRSSTTRNQRTTGANLHSTSDSTAANSQSSASVTGIASKQAVPATSRALAHAHLAQSMTTNDDYASTSTTDSVVAESVYPAMTTQSEDFEEHAPAPAVAQVAPTSSATSAGPDTQTDSQSRTQTSPRPGQAVPAPVSHMPITTVDRDSGSPSISLMTEVHPPERTQPRVDPQAHTTSPAQEDVEMVLQPQEDVCMDLQSQAEKPVNHMTPVKSASMQDPETTMHTPPSATSPSATSTAAEDAGSKSALPEGPATLPTPAPSDRAPSPLAELFNRSRGPIAEHHRHARIFSKTRELMRCSTRTTSVVASRGFEREPLPTRQTKPPLLKRRYSIDVNTTNTWNTRRTFLKEEDREPHQLDLRSLELTDPSTSILFPPFPARYAAFASIWHLQPPFNTEIYLELGDATIRNDAFAFITTTEHEWGLEVWMRDESLDMALEVLRRDADCDAHGIAIANSTMAQICYFANFSEDSAPQEYDEYKARFRDKNWIFLVVNDAIGGMENDGRSGSHWSLVAMDVHYRRAYYYDSLFPNSDYHLDMGRSISLGMLKILGEDPGRWKYLPQYDCPNQNWHNQFKYDAGACGPFVYKMTQILVDKIKAYRRLNKEHECYINIGWEFRAQFKGVFHSLEVRKVIQRKIARWKGLAEARDQADRHDYDAIRNAQGVTLIDGPVVQFDAPLPRLFAPLPEEPCRLVRFTNHYRSQPHHRSGSNRDDAIEVQDSDSELSSNAYTYGNADVHDIELDEPEDDYFERNDVDIIMSDNDNTVEDDYVVRHHSAGSSRDIVLDDDEAGGVQLPEHSDDEVEVQAVSRVI